MSTGPGATGRRDSERRMVDELDRDDPVARVALSVDGLRRSEGLATERRIDGAGSKPFSNMAAMASALMEPLLPESAAKVPERPTDDERRIVARRRRIDERLSVDGDEVRISAPDSERVETFASEPETDETPPASGDVTVGVDSRLVRFDDGERTTGATGRSTRSARR